MKKLLIKYSHVIASIALLVTAANVNTACACYLNQPKLPNGAEKLRKF